MKVDSRPEPAEYPDPPEGLRAPGEAECAVYLLGPMRIEREGRPVEGGWRRKSLELLAYLAVHPRGVARDQILEALWPGGGPGITQRYLWHSTSYLRSRLRGAGVDARVTHKIDDLHRLNFDAIWVDVQAFEQAIRQAVGVSDSRALLAFACDIYKGEFCEGRYFGWATLVCERLRSELMEASRGLAVRLEQDRELGNALIVLDRAHTSDPYDEDLARLAMAIEAQLGRRDLVVRRFRRLRRLLVTHLGVEPSKDTADLLSRLTTNDTPVVVSPCPHTTEQRMWNTQGTAMNQAGNRAGRPYWPRRDASRKALTLSTVSHTIRNTLTRKVMRPLRALVSYSDGQWIARDPSFPDSSVTAPTRERCLAMFVAQAHERSNGDLFVVVEEDPPALVGVYEVADLLEWDRRKVAVYAARGQLPQPVAELAGGRVWRRADIEDYAHGRQLERPKPGRPRKKRAS